MPLREEYYPTKYTIFSAKFQLGFFTFKIHLVDSKDTLNDTVRVLAQTVNPALGRRYICMLTIGRSSWLWYSSDELKVATMEYKKVLAELKEGDNVIFDDFGEPKTRPIRLSWRGLEIEW